MTIHNVLRNGKEADVKGMVVRLGAELLLAKIGRRT